MTTSPEKINPPKKNNYRGLIRVILIPKLIMSWPQICKYIRFVATNVDLQNPIYCPKLNYRKVASWSTSRLVARPGIFRLFMKGKFDPYALWPFAYDLWIVDRSTARNFTVLNTSEIKDLAKTKIKLTVCIIEYIP